MKNLSILMIALAMVMANGVFAQSKSNATQKKDNVNIQQATDVKVDEVKEGKPVNATTRPGAAKPANTTNATKPVNAELTVEQKADVYSQNRTNMLDQVVGLDDAQKTKIHGWGVEYFLKGEELKAKYKGQEDSDAAKAAKKAMGEKKDAGLVKILSAEQYEKYQSFMNSKK